MDNTLDNSSGIFKLKSRFFLFRAVTYFSFILLPIWIQKTLHLNQGTQVLLMFLYCLFMLGQYFLLGKEIDHRLKIYFRVNSSIDRLIYRVLLGMSFFVLYFNLLSFLPWKWVYNSFWITWAILGLFYSWPTRGKIIQETVTSNFSEYRYLDSFEKTLVSLIVIMFIISLPELPKLTGVEALKLFFDGKESFAGQFWDYLIVNYFPFYRYPKLLMVAWCTHFYVVGMGLFLLIFYAIQRFFLSRRLSLLGVFALLSSWSYSKFLAHDFGYALSSTYSIFWVWTLLWITKSATYRSGLFLGLAGYLGSLLSPAHAIYSYIQLFFVFFVFLEEKTSWHKRQLLRYSIFGMVLSGMILVTRYEVISFSFFDFGHLKDIGSIMGRKAFYSLSIFGLIIAIVKLMGDRSNRLKDFKLDMTKFKQLSWSIAVLLITFPFLEGDFKKSFTLMWPIVILSLFPLELLFQSISRLRSRRNMIYLIYILICLLDSHFEGRVKIFMRIFDS